MATKILQITIGLLSIGLFIYLCFFKVYVIYKPHTTHGQPTEVKGIAAYQHFSNTASHFLSNYNQTLKVNQSQRGEFAHANSQLIMSGFETMILV